MRRTGRRVQALSKVRALRSPRRRLHLHVPPLRRAFHRQVPRVQDRRQARDRSPVPHHDGPVSHRDQDPEVAATSQHHRAVRRVHRRRPHLHRHGADGGGGAVRLRRPEGDADGGGGEQDREEGHVRAGLHAFEERDTQGHEAGEFAAGAQAEEQSRHRGQDHRFRPVQDFIGRSCHWLLPRNSGLPRARNDTTPKLHEVRRRVGPRRHYLRPPLRLPPLRRRLPDHPQLSRPPGEVHAALPPLGEGPVGQCQGPAGSAAHGRQPEEVHCRAGDGAPVGEGGDGEQGQPASEPREDQAEPRGQARRRGGRGV
mmetsp:Transcript_55930/g.118939  ORF Transcript_55930/g.118939 Transcript_55930/m.118939 type:complete len:312 (+) Transcript_55930:583-1518(+)